MRERVKWVLTASSFTLGLAIAVITGYYLGSWVDARYRTGSLFSVLLVMAAIAGGFFNVYRHVTRQRDK